MVAPTHARLSIVRQCHLVSIARSSFYYEGQGESPVNLRLLRVIDEQFLETPFYGSRQITRWLRRQGDTVSRKRVRRLMRRLGVHAVCQRPRTSQSHPGHRIYPYLLRDLQITQPNHVWCTDVTYIPLQRGFLYLVAVMDWASRTVLSWRLSNTLEANFCVEALHEALERYGPPEIFNSDQGSQFTSVEFTDVLKEAGIRISMDGKGRWMDNVFIERLWRSLKYECVYLAEFATGSQARTEIGWWMDFYNRRRPHSSLNDRTPEEAYTDHGANRSLTTETSPTLREGFGVGAHTAAELLIVFGDNPDRIRSEAAFAKLCGACPLPASSGMTTGRHRLNRGGHRHANAALYRAVIVRMRYHQPTVDDVARRTADGRTKREIIRCLKRFLAREIYQRVMTDFRARQELIQAA